MYAVYGNMDPINIPPMLAYVPYMDPMGNGADLLMIMDDLDDLVMDDNDNMIHY